MKTKALSRAGTHVGSLTNYLFANAKDETPKIGMGATVVHWTDRTAHTIVDVRDAKTIVTQPDTAIRTDNNGMSESQDYAYTPNPNAKHQVWTLRSNGAWVKQGEPAKGGTRILLGTRETYVDPSF